MRRILLASAAALAASGGIAAAQPVASPMQGQLAAPYGAGGNTTNNNNGWGIANTPSGSAAAGPLSTIRAPNTYAVPSPGTLVIHVNGRVEADITANYTTGDVVKAPTGGYYKLNPVGVASDVRIYLGADGLAANGLRYGGAIEMWQNWGPAYNNASNPTAATAPGGSGSTNSSAQTLFVRKEFAYIASDQVGIVRIGGAEGVIGIMDPCIFSSQCWDAGIGTLNGGGSLGMAPSNLSIPWVFSSQSGAEYATDKVTYLSPQYYGFDFVANWVPNKGNMYNQTAAGNPNTATACSIAGPGCIGLASGNDPTRFTNMFGVGLRYMETFGAVDFKAYGLGEVSGKADLSTSAYTPTIGRSLTQRIAAGVGAATVPYDDFGFYQAGVAVTFANFTFAFDYMGGRINGQMGLDPTGGAPMNAGVGGVTYVNGPWTLGAMLEIVNTQGDARLVGLTQRHQVGTAIGGNYKLAPGLQLVLEYQYEQQHQGGYNFMTGAVGTTADSRAQGLLGSIVMNW